MKFNEAFNIRFDKENLGFLFFLFSCIFAPPFFPKINFMLIMAIYSAFRLLTKYSDKVLKILFESKIMFFTIGLFCFFLYLLISTSVNIFNGNIVDLHHYIIIWYRFLIILIYLICVLYTIIRAEILNYTFYDIIMALIIIGVIQSVINIITLLFPIIKEYLLDFSYFMTNDSVLLNETLREKRLYGFANNLLDTFGYGTGIIAALPIFISIYTKRIKYLMLVPLLLLVPLMNARSGLIIFAFMLMIGTLGIFQLDTKNRRKFLMSMLCICAIFIGVFFVFSFVNPSAVQSTVKDLTSIFKFVFTGQRDIPGLNTASNLFNPIAWYLPNSFFQVLFGSGHTIFSLSGFQHSDVGYINDIWLCGVLGSSLLYGLFFYIFKQSIRTNEKLVKLICCGLIISLFIFQIKGRAIMYNTGIAITLLIFFSSIYYSNITRGKEIKINYQNIENQNNDLISIIVPVYNVEKYLEDCIDSILNQTYQYIEIILINDGSPDNCPQICDAYQFKDSRIRTIHQKNKGLSGARNTGIKDSKGKYLVFIDSDDFISKDFISDLYTSIKANNADISVCDYYETNELGNIIKTNQKSCNHIELSSMDVLEDVFSYPNFVGVMAWNKLYKKELFVSNDIYYPEGKIHEDEFTTYKLFDMAHKINYLNKPLYYYRQRPNSIMTKNIVQRANVYYDIVDSINDYYLERKYMKELLFSKEFLLKLTLYYDFLDYDINNEFSKMNRNFIKSNYVIILKSKYIKGYHKVISTMIKFGIYEKIHKRRKQ